MGRAEVQATCVGYVGSTEDADLLLDACLQGILLQVPRRLRVDEHQSLIKSGNIFIYDESVSNIKRWTDGRAWTPRRSSGDFHIYHELQDKKGSMPKEAGLVRKMINLCRNGVSYRLVSYFTEEDVHNGTLATPSSYVRSEDLGDAQTGVTYSDSQDLEDTLEQLLSQQLAMCLAPADDIVWGTSQPWLEQEADLEFDQEFWLGLGNESSTDFIPFETLDLAQSV